MKENRKDDLQWFRLLRHNPKSVISDLTEAFGGILAKRLSIQPAKIYWFMEAEAEYADRCFDEAVNSRRDLNWDMDNPLILPCEYFRLRVGQDEDICGYTPRNAVGDLLISAEMSLVKTLGILAHEYRHYQQDCEHGSAWRMDNLDEAERQADDFQNQVLAHIL